MRILLLLILATPAFAQAPEPDVFGPQSLEDYIRDLQSSSPGKRTFAARELRRQVRQAVRLTQKQKGDELWVAEAQIKYADLRLHVAPVAARSMRKFGDVRVACADMLGLLDEERYVPELRSALEMATTRRQRRRVQAAIDLLEEP